MPDLYSFELIGQGLTWITLICFLYIVYNLFIYVFWIKCICL